MDARVSPSCILIRDHPGGGGQLVGGGGLLSVGVMGVNVAVQEEVKIGNVLVSPGSIVAASTV
jgi:hypothetical protein